MRQACPPSFLLCRLGALGLAAQRLWALLFLSIWSLGFCRAHFLRFLEMLVLPGYVRATES